MCNHPLWSPMRKMTDNSYQIHPLNIKMCLETTHRNMQQAPGSSPNIYTWQPGPEIADWCREEYLIDVNSPNDPKLIESRCLDLLTETYRSREFRDILTNGMNVVRQIPIYNRRNVERAYEALFHAANINKKGRALTAEEIEEGMLSHLANSSYLPHEIDDIVDYCKYRHTEFRHNFFVIGDVEAHNVELTIFAYILPEKRKIEKCRYGKASICITNKQFHRKYQTCRWYLGV